MAGSRSELKDRYRGTCNCARSTAAVEAAAIGAMRAENCERVVHGTDDQNRRSLMTWKEKPNRQDSGFLNFLGSFDLASQCREKVCVASMPAASNVRIFSFSTESSDNCLRFCGSFTIVHKMYGVSVP